MVSAWQLEREVVRWSELKKSLRPSSGFPAAGRFPDSPIDKSTFSDHETATEVRLVLTTTTDVTLVVAFGIKRQSDRYLRPKIRM